MSGTKINLLPEVVTETKTALYPQYKVLAHDDNKTEFGFVLWVIMEVWNLPMDKAYKIVLEAHYRKVGLVAIESFEKAEFHIDKAHSLARTAKFPLKFSMELA